GTSFEREAMMHVNSRTATRMISRTSCTRLNSNHVPSNRIAGGKNSSSEGMWKNSSSASSAGLTSAVFSSISRGRMVGRSRAGLGLHNDSLHPAPENTCFAESSAQRREGRSFGADVASGAREHLPGMHRDQRSSTPESITEHHGWSWTSSS